MDEIKKNIAPKWLQVGILIVGAGLVVVGLFQIFGGGEKFVNKFNELQTPAMQVKDDLTVASNLLAGVGDKEQNQDYAGIVSDLQIALAKLNDAETKVAATQKVLVEFQALVNASSSQEVKTAGARFIAVYNERNAAVLKMASDTKSLLNSALAYYKTLAKGETAVLAEAELAAATNAITADSQVMVSVGAKYDSAVNDLAKAVGFSVEKQ